MKTIYVVAPCALLAAFVSVFIPANARLNADLLAARQAEAQRVAREREEREAQARRAHAELEQRLADLRLAQQGEEARRRETEEAGRRALHAELDHARAIRDGLRAEVVEFEAGAESLRIDHDHMTATLLALRTEVEHLRIARRTADLLLQHAIQFVAARLGAHPLANTPVFPHPEMPHVTGPSRPASSDLL